MVDLILQVHFLEWKQNVICVRCSLIAIENKSMPQVYFYTLLFLRHRE